MLKIPFLNPVSRWYYPLHWLVLILLGLAIYARTFGYNFVFDDLDFIVHNPCIRRFGLVHYIWKMFPQSRTIGFYSFAFNYFINQLHPQGYHIFNFIIHLAAVGLIWATAGVLFKITGWLPSGDRIRQETPFIIAVLFLVHPCQTEAVTYISQRFESMACVFYLGSIYAYLCGRRSSFRPHKIILFVCCAGFAILGILTKEVSATIPLMILTCEFIFFNSNYRRFKGIVLTCGIVIFFMLFIKLVRTDFNIFYFHTIPSQSHDGDMITVQSYLLTQMRVFLTFMRLLVWPFPQNLDYDYPLSKGLFYPPETFVGMCLMGALVVAIFKLRKKFPIMAFGLAWILITFSINLAPRSNVIFEHKLYLISFGFFLILVSALTNIIRQKKLLVVLLIALIAIWSYSSFLRNQVWKDGVTLWNDVVRKSPHKARAFDNLGLSYNEQGDFTEAIKDLNIAIQINPKYIVAYYNRGFSYAHLGHFTQAIADYNKAIELDSVFAEAIFNRGVIYEKQGNFSQALRDYNKAIEIKPNYADAYTNRGGIYAKKGDFTQAMLDFTKAIQYGTLKAEAYVNQGAIFAQKGDFTQAMSDFTKAIEINPHYAEAYYNRAVFYFQLKEFDKAWDDVHKAEKLRYPVNPGFINDLKKASM